MYENRHTRPLPARMFAVRMASHVGVAAVLVLLSLVAGMAGYEHYERLPWRDAPHTNGGKLFAGVFALYSGVVFLVVAGLFLAPVVHRIMHRFHWEPPKS